MPSRRIEGQNGVSFTFADDDPTPGQSVQSPPARPSLLDAQPHDGPLGYDADVARYAQNASGAAPKTANDATSALPAANDQILYLGANTDKNQADNEFKNLNFVAGGKATQIKTSTDSSITAANGQKFDLGKPGDVDAWSKTLGLPDAKATAVATAIKNASGAGRDELAQIATVWAKGENGGSVPSRLVLSGHVADRLMDADGSNGIESKDIQALAKAMPRAAAQVEDVMVSACYGGSKEQIDAWRGAFPNAKSIWTYGDGGHTVRDKSPTGAVAVEHLVEWEKETRGRSLPTAKPTTTMDEMGKSTLHNVTLWTGSYHVRS